MISNHVEVVAMMAQCQANGTDTKLYNSWPAGKSSRSHTVTRTTRLHDYPEIKTESDLILTIDYKEAISIHRTKGPSV